MRTFPAASPTDGSMNRFFDEKYRDARLAKEKAERKSLEVLAVEPKEPTYIFERWHTWRGAK